MLANESATKRRTPVAGFHHAKGNLMLRYALIFLVIALIAAFLGFGSLAGLSATIAKILFLVFLVLAAVSFLLNIGRGRGPTVP